jgi:hypothetical protein
LAAVYFQAAKGDQAKALAKGRRKNKTRKAKAVAGCWRCRRVACTQGLRSSGHEDGNEGQQEDQHSASGRNDHGNVLDHVFHGIVRCVCVVVSGHGLPQNKNARIVAKPGQRLPYIKA